MKKKIVVAMGVLLLAVNSFGAHALLAPGDAIIAVDADGLVSNSSYPGGEAPAKVLDSTPSTKYLNFGKENSGFIVTLAAGAAAVQSFTLTTANDAVARDPLTWMLWGTNDAIVSADNSTGLAENWTLIDSGTVALPDARMTLGPVVSFANSTAYSSYKMMYPTLKNAPATNSMQVADVAFYETSDASGTNVMTPSNLILAVHAGPDSSYPGAENPANLIDGSANTKYLNFGEKNSGFIVTPSAGLTMVQGFQITTANDVAERDPTSWILYGTNDPITSGDNSDGLAENWILIDSGDLVLPADRFTLGDLVAVDNADFFASYKLLFPTLKSDTINCMQIAEIQFYGIPEPMTLCFLGMGGLALLRRRS